MVQFVQIVQIIQIAQMVQMVQIGTEICTSAEINKQVGKTENSNA